MLSGVMPIGANVYLITARYQAYEERASTAILLSTALSVITVSALTLTVG